MQLYKGLALNSPICKSSFLDIYTLSFLPAISLQMSTKLPPLFLILLVILYGLEQGGCNLVLTGPSSPYCFERTYQLICTHPKLNPQVYFPGIAWRRNGKAFNADGFGVPEVEFSINDTATALDITITKEMFSGKSFDYSCAVLIQNISSYQSSNEMTVNPQEAPPPPYNITYLAKTTNLSISWKYQSICFSNATFEVKICQGGTQNCRTFTDKNEDSVAVDSLSSDTTYQVTIKTRSNGYTSETEDHIIRTLKSLTVSVSQDSVCIGTILKLTCSHDDPTSNDNLATADPIVWMDRGVPVIAGISKPSSTETVLTLDTSQEFIRKGPFDYACIYNYKDGSMEKSKIYVVASNRVDNSTAVISRYGKQDSPNVNKILVIELPLKPDITERNTRENSASVKWTHNDSCFESECKSRMFVVKWILNSTNSLVGLANTSKNTYKIGGLEEDVCYRVEIMAICSGMESPHEAEIIETENINNVHVLVGVIVGVLIPVFLICIFITIIITILWIKKKKHISKLTTRNEIARNELVTLPHELKNNSPEFVE